jgi:hypothetical protein
MKISILVYFISIINAFPVFINKDQELDVNDPCFELGSTGEYTYTNILRRCLDSFPFDHARHLKQVLNVKKAMAMYVFRDIASNFADGAIESHTDIMHELDAISQKTYANDRMANEDLYDAFLKLNDAHTRYVASCYHSWKIMQPWVLSMKYNDQKQYEIFIQDMVYKPDQEPFDMIKYILSAPPTDYIGYKVLEIDGIPAINALVDFALKHVGTAKDPNVRLNLAVGRFDYHDGAWRPFYGDFSVRLRLPEKDNVVYLLQAPNGTTISVSIPFITQKFGAPFITSEEYWLKICASDYNSTRGGVQARL